MKKKKKNINVWSKITNFLIKCMGGETYNSIIPATGQNMKRIINTEERHYKKIRYRG